MNMMSTKAMDRQPTNFDGLSTAAMKIDGVVLARSLKCVCGNEHLQIFAGKWPEEAAWLDPVKYECSACGVSKEIFNSQTDGYDGILCGGGNCLQNSDSELVRCLSCGSSELKLTASLFYNIDYDDPQELAELNDEQKAALSDLYDALALSGTCKACAREIHIGDWELA